MRPLAKPRYTRSSREALRAPEVIARRIASADAPYAILAPEAVAGAHGYRLDIVSYSTYRVWHIFRTASATMRHRLTWLALEAEARGWPVPYYGRLRTELERLGYGQLARHNPVAGSASLIDYRAVAELLLTRPILPLSTVENMRAAVREMYEAGQL